MTKIVNLVQAAPNAKLIDGLREMLAQAERGEIEGIAGVKLRPDNGFASYRIGACSDLELAGALAFATHDLIAGNEKK
jgi:hypothetical protein